MLDSLEQPPPPTHASVRVLVVDDDPDLCRLLGLGLARAGFECAMACDGVAAVEELSARAPGHYHLILLDVSMPRRNGWELLAALREAGDDVPVIFVSGHGEVHERVRGLRLGADDFVVKPFLMDELVLRVEAVLRRRRTLAPIVIGELRLDLARRKVERSGVAIDLSPREFDILYVLARAHGHLVSREELLREVWDMKFDPETNVLDVHLGRLRRKLDRHGRPAIQTERGAGFRIALDSLHA